MPPPLASREDRLPAPTLLLLAAGAGLAVATIYYSQPLLALLAEDFGTTATRAGGVATATQLGYGVGVVLLAPLGDKLDRRRVILGKSVLLMLSLIAAALAPSIEVLIGASAVIGLFATIAQDFVPAAATLAPDHARGRIVGMVMTGLLLGILLSRAVSGITAGWLGWRAVFVGAAMTIVLLLAAAARLLPRFAPTTDASYLALLRSLGTLLRRHAPLRRAALTQSLLSLAFSAFWSTLAFTLQRSPYHLGPTAVGAFGFAGAAGAVAAPVAGSIADRRGPPGVIRLGTSIVLASFVSMGLCQHSIPVLIVGAVVFDLGVQASMIAHQTIIYALDPASRSRLNAVLLGSMFVGMSLGSVLASRALSRFGWSGVCTTGAVAAVLALLVALGWKRG